MASPINFNWVDEEGNHAGGVSSGVGFTIAWQRGPLQVGRNGAFLIEVLQACESQLQHFQSGKFACRENEIALQHLSEAINALESRRQRRMAEGKLGTHEA
jgi:hypothetical protein